MSSNELQSAFIVRVKKSDKIWRFIVDDLRQGQRLEFDSWQALQCYVERVMQHGLR